MGHGWNRESRCSDDGFRIVLPDSYLVYVMQMLSSDEPRPIPPRTWPLHVRCFFSAISSALSDSRKKNKGLESPSVGWVLALERGEPSSNEHQRHHWPVPTLLKPSIAVSGSILVTMHHSLLISLKRCGGNGSKRQKFLQKSFFVEQRRGLYLICLLYTSPSPRDRG